LTAAWLHGLDVEPCRPVEATVPEGSTVAGRVGIRLRRAKVERSDVVSRKGFECTSIHRTLVDVSQRLTLVESVVLADMALHAGLVTLAELQERAMRSAAHRGVRRFRRVVNYAEPKTESPMESRLRMLLVLGRLPRPEAQVVLRNDAGEILARADLYFPAERLVIEYDGGTHRESIVEDDRRQNLLVRGGYTILRFAAADLGSPVNVIRLVRAALTDARRRAALADPRR
jgi:very-short-patch-repair endonuclease